MSNSSDPIQTPPTTIPAATSSTVDPAPSPTPTQTTAAPSPTDVITPFLGPFMALLRSKKGIVVLGALAFCLVIYFRDPSKLDKILQFLMVTIPVWLGAQGYEDGQKHAANSTNGSE